ncbi:MAG TPA: type II secretion system protein [Patescibacteria group bacterium]|nr:type II secretion system protein [Patescibacteria group bacterium]
MEKRGKGFTVIEVLIVMAVMIILMGAIMPVSSSFLNKNDLDLTVQKIVQSVRRAQFLAQATDSDSTWGIHAQSGSVILFKGANYSARDATRDEIYTFSNNEVLDGTTDFLFSKLTGFPTATGTLSITSSDASVRNVSINAFGIVQY